MPLRTYSRSLQRPPSLKDHFYAHPYELLLAGFGTIIGVCLVISQALDILGPGHEWFVVNPELERISDWLAGAYGLVLALGSVLTISGLLDDQDDLMIGWARERTGLLLAASAWSSISVTILMLQPDRVFAWGLSLSVAISSLIRFRATQIEEARTRRVKALGD